MCERERLKGTEEEEEEGVVCAFCVWLLCLPVITPCNLAVKGWP